MLQVNDQPMGLKTEGELFVLSLYIKAMEAVCSETWPLLLPLPASLPQALLLHSLQSSFLTENLLPSILHKIATPTTTYSPQENFRLNYISRKISSSIQLLSTIKILPKYLIIAVEQWHKQFLMIMVSIILQRIKPCQLPEVKKNGKSRSISAKDTKIKHSYFLNSTFIF